MGVEKVSDLVELFLKNEIDLPTVIRDAPSHHTDWKVWKFGFDRGVSFALEFKGAHVDGTLEARWHHLHDAMAVGADVGDDVFDVAVDFEALAAGVECVVVQCPVWGVFGHITPRMSRHAATNLFEVRAINQLREIRATGDGNRPVLDRLGIAPAAVIPALSYRNAHFGGHRWLGVLRVVIPEGGAVAKCDEAGFSQIFGIGLTRRDDGVSDGVFRQDFAINDELCLEEKLTTDLLGSDVWDQCREAQVMFAGWGKLR